MQESDFGKGFVYNLFLFAKHWMMHRESYEFYKEKFSVDRFYEVWFNGSSDHFYELEIPKQWENTEIGKKAKAIADRAVELGHGFNPNKSPKEQDFIEIFEECEELCLLIDKKLGIKPIKAKFN